MFRPSSANKLQIPRFPFGLLDPLYSAPAPFGMTEQTGPANSAADVRGRWRPFRSPAAERDSDSNCRLFAPATGSALASTITVSQIFRLRLACRKFGMVYNGSNVWMNEQLDLGDLVKYNSPSVLAQSKSVCSFWKCYSETHISYNISTA